jgi:hypothetical protein
LRAGIPSHDRFNAIFSMLSPAEFERCLLGWIQAIHEATGVHKRIPKLLEMRVLKEAIGMARGESLGQTIADESRSALDAYAREESPADAPKSLGVRNGRLSGGVCRQN